MGSSSTMYVPPNHRSRQIGMCRQGQDVAVGQHGQVVVLTGVVRHEHFKSPSRISMMPLRRPQSWGCQCALRARGIPSLVRHHACVVIAGQLSMRYVFPEDVTGMSV